MYESHIFELRMKTWIWKGLRSNEHYLSNRETKAWKRFKPVRVWTHELCDTDAALHQLS